MGVKAPLGIKVKHYPRISHGFSGGMPGVFLYRVRIPTGPLPKERQTVVQVKLVKYILRVLDKKIPENSWESNPMLQIYPLLRELENTYGQEIVANNFDSLIDGDVVTFSIANKHNVSVQISEEN